MDDANNLSATFRQQRWRRLVGSGTLTLKYNVIRIMFPTNWIFSRSISAQKNHFDDYVRRLLQYCCFHSISSCRSPHISLVQRFSNGRWIETANVFAVDVVVSHAQWTNRTMQTKRRRATIVPCISTLFVSYAWWCLVIFILRYAHFI